MPQKKNFVYLTMRKLFILPMFILFSCGSEVSESNIEVVPEDVTSSVNQSESPNLVVIGHYNVRGGELHVYSLCGDTIYWAEGQSASFPVSIVIK